MMKTNSCIILVLVAIASAQDPDCRPPPPGGPPNMDKIVSCCKTPLLIEESIMTKCFEENKPTGPPPAGPPPAGGPGAGGPGGPGGPMCCVGQCALTAIGIFNNNKIDKEAAVKYLTTRANGDATVLSVWTTALDTCVAKAASKEAEFAQLLSQAPQGGKACNPSSGFVMACMFQNTITNCPASIWTNDAECNAIKAHAEKCPMPHM